MTDRTDVARGRDIVARWCGLAEQRLDYLHQLFESGRWRRYYSERDFLENIREAKSAVEAWRKMLTDSGMPESGPLDLSWIGRRPAVLIANEGMSVAPAQPAAPPRAVDQAPITPTEAVQVPPEATLDKTLALTLDMVAKPERYPLLRNAFKH